MGHCRNSKKRNSRASSKRKRQEPETNQQQLTDVIKWLLDEKIFEGISFHGNTSWRPFELIVLTLSWVWSESSKITEAFEDAVIRSEQLTGSVALSTYQGFAGALETWTPHFIPLLQVRIHGLLQKIGGKHFRTGIWVAIAMDGSRSTTPRSLSNEAAFCAPNYGQGHTARVAQSRKGKNQKKKTQRPQSPQIWITLMYHLGLGIPWCWKLGPSYASEREHVKELLSGSHFVKNTLFVGDAGFTGYDLWKQIIEQGHHVMVRVGSNVRLLRSLGYFTRPHGKQTVYCWPDAMMSKKLPPLVFRLVKCKIGKKNIWLLTSVLDKKDLNVKEMKVLYQKRWGVELEFRALKQTFGRNKLHSRKPQRALCEMEWSIMGMTIIELFALKSQLKARQQPDKLSFAKALRVVQRSLKYLGLRSPQGITFTEQLRNAQVDTYRRPRNKAARYHPKRKRKPSVCGKPRVIPLNRTHRKILKQTPWKTAA